MRRNAILSAAGVVTLGLALGACSSDGEDENVLIISGTATDRAALEAVVSDFEDVHPDLEIRTTFADTSSYYGPLRTQLSSGSGPDVFQVWPGNGNPAAIHVLEAGGFLKDQSDQDWADTVPAGFDSVTMVDDKRYMFPTGLSGLGMIYNEQAVEDAGAKVPETWSGVLEFCETAEEAGKIGFSLGNQTDWVTQLVNYALVPTLVYADNPDFDDQMAKGEASFVDSGWSESFEKYMEMYENGCFSAQPLGTSYDASVTQVATGEALATVQVTSTFNQVRAEAPEGTTFGLAPLPGTDNKDDTWMPAAASIGYAVNAKAEHAEMAQEFVNFMASSEQIANYATVGGSLPAMPTDDYDLEPALQVVSDYQDAGKGVAFMDQLWPNAKVQQVHLEGVQRVMSGSSSIEEVLEDMDDAYSEGLEEE